MSQNNETLIAAVEAALTEGQILSGKLTGYTSQTVTAAYPAFAAICERLRSLEAENAKLKAALKGLLDDIITVDYDSYDEVYRCNFCYGHTHGEGSYRDHDYKTFTHEESCVLMNAKALLAVSEGNNDVTDDHR